jgi:tetratricopeptide (TPR) repeat protein
MKQSYFDMQINPSPIYAAAKMQAIQYNNEGLALKERGQYDAAEKKYLKALDLKLMHVGQNEITTALSHNALGELYIAMNRLDEAEKHLELAVKIRNADGPTFDAAASRENLAIVYEMRGDLLAAKRMRKSTGTYACGNYNVCVYPAPDSSADHSSTVSRSGLQQERAQTMRQVHCKRLFQSMFVAMALTFRTGHLLLYPSVPGGFLSDGHGNAMILSFIESRLETSQNLLSQVDVDSLRLFVTLPCLPFGLFDP